MAIYFIVTPAKKIQSEMFTREVDALYSGSDLKWNPERPPDTGGPYPQGKLSDAVQKTLCIDTTATEQNIIDLISAHDYDSALATLQTEQYNATLLIPVTNGEPPDEVFINNGYGKVYVDETLNQLWFKVKYSDGTIKKGLLVTLT